MKAYRLEWAVSNYRKAESRHIILFCHQI
jgi:hypothetical protein